MKKTILFLLAIMTFSAANAQNKNEGYAVFAQFLNLSNTHARAINDTTTGTLYLTGALWNSSGIPAANPQYGTGTVTFNASVLHASTITTVSPAVQFIPQGSFDGTTWVTLPGITVLTLTATSTTVPVTGTYTVSVNCYPYYRGKFIAGSDTASVKCWMWFNRTFFYSN